MMHRSLDRQRAELSAVPRRGTGARSPDRDSLAHALGNRELERLLREGRARAKLVVSRYDDEAEREADEVAEGVMHAHRTPCHCGGRCAACRGGSVLQRQENAGRAHSASSRPAPGADFQPVPGGGRPLDHASRSFMEPLFGRDFASVRIHTGEDAAAAARAVSALAFTVGGNIVFGEGQYAPHTTAGRRLMAHELAHVVQQRTAAGSGARLQRQASPPSAPIGIRSPAFEEAVTQISTVESGIHGRPLYRDERELVRAVFGASVDYARVRLIPTNILEFRTVANTIRIPPNFSIATAWMAQTLVHEMTHVWQYQHTGTAYISISLAKQAEAAASKGNRNFAYDYTIKPGMSFFEFAPEQQGLLVENYFAMLRDQAAIPTHLAARISQSYDSNHMDPATGFPASLSAADRQAEIASELPLHEPLIRQLRAALPRAELDLLQQRATDVMQPPPAARGLPASEERSLTPLKPLLEIPF